jgi:hypothetical protein
MRDERDWDGTHNKTQHTITAVYNITCAVVAFQANKTSLSRYISLASLIPAQLAKRATTDAKYDVHNYKRRRITGTVCGKGILKYFFIYITELYKLNLCVLNLFFQLFN